jgi:hypothetical protein
MTPESASAIEPQPQGMGEFSRLTGVVFEPKKTFEDVAQRPTFWIPLLLLTVIAVVATYLISSRIGWETIVRQQSQQSASAQQRLEQMPPEQRQRMEEMQAKIAPIAGYGFAILGRPIGFLLAAAILLGIVRGIMSAPVRFKQIWSILWYASIPSIIQTALMCVVMFLKRPEEFNLQNPLAFNPAAFMDPMTSSKFAYAVAKSIDLFTIWTLLLVALGLTAAGGKKMSFTGALVAVLVPWAVLVLGGASLAGLFG